MFSLDNFIKGPLTSLLGLAMMAVAPYAWYIDYLTNWEAAGFGVTGFALLFMREKLPEFITQFAKGTIEKFTGKNSDQK